MGKNLTKTPNRMCEKIAFRDEKRSAILPMLPEKNTRKKTLDDTSQQIDVYLIGKFDKTWILHRETQGWVEVQNFYPVLQRRQAWAMSNVEDWAGLCGGFTLWFLKPTMSLKKLNPMPVAYPPCFPAAEKGSSEKCYIREYSSKNLTLFASIRWCGLDSVWGFIRSKIRLRLFSFLNPKIISTFTK